MLADAVTVMEVFNLKLVDHSGHHDIASVLQSALLTGTMVSGEYESPYEKSPLKLRLHPYRLCLIKRAWYVIGHTEDHAAPRTFRIARFKSLSATETTANIPSEFCLREYFGDAWGVFRGDKTYDIHLKFDRSAAKVVCETHWHHTQVVTRHRDGTVTLKFRADGLNEILNWILGWTGNVVIQRPSELKRAYIEALRKGINGNVPDSDRIDAGKAGETLP